MKRVWIASIVAALGGACGRHPAALEEKPKAFGAALVSVSGGKQTAAAGAQLDQPVVVQVNDAQGAAVAGAPVRFAGADGVTFRPDHGLTGADGQFTTSVSLGGVRGHYEIAATTSNAAGKRAEVRIDEIALGYQETLGEELNQIHCVRCHDSESTPGRVSNQGNLEAKAHSFTDGAVLNSMSDAALAAIISHGGAALNKSAEMPPYGNTLNKTEIDALVAFLRAVADPPYRPGGVFYAGN